MRKIIFIFLFIASHTVVFAQEEKIDSIGTDSISTEYINEKIITVEGKVFTETTDRYKIYPTSNMYNFIKLDTRTGVIRRIQWDLKDNKRYETSISYKILVGIDDEWKNGRFEVYPTQNIYNFLLLDKINGRTWQFQWGFDANENWIERIY
jgi:hypothetical protein